MIELGDRLRQQGKIEALKTFNTLSQLLSDFENNQSGGISFGSITRV